MPLTFQQFQELRRKGLSPEQIASFEAGNKPAGVTAFPQEQPNKQGFFSKVQNFIENTLPNTLGGGTLSLAKSAFQPIKGTTESIVSGPLSKLPIVNQAIQSQDLADQGALDLLKAIRTNRELGRDTSRLEATFKDVTGQPAFDFGEVIPASTKSNRQALGEVAGTVAYILPYGKIAGAASKVAGKVVGRSVAGATGGYLADVGMGLTDENQTLGQAFTPGLGTAIGGSAPLVGPTLRGVGRGTQKVGEKIASLGTPIGELEAGILQTYKANNPFLKRVSDVLKGVEKSPQTTAKTMVQTKSGQTIGGLFGTPTQIGIQAKRAQKSLWGKVVAPALDNGNAVDMDGFFVAAEKRIIESTDDITRQKSLLKALDAIKKDYSGVKVVSLSQLQKYKEGWTEFLPNKVFKGEDVAAAANSVRKSLSEEARNAIYEQLGPDIRQAYLDYGNLKGLAELGKKSMAGSKFKGGSGSFISGLVEETVTPVSTLAGQIVYRTGKGIEFVGSAGQKFLKGVLGITRAPGDKLVDDINAGINSARQIAKKTGTQGGFIQLGQEAKAPITKQAIQAAKINNKASNISSNIPQEIRADITEAGVDTGSAYLNRLNKYEEEARETAKKAVKASKRPKAQGGKTATVYKGEKDLTTKILKDLEGKTTVSKQYILDATNRGELKQVERDLIRNMLEGEKDVVNVSDFAKKVKAELLPLKVSSPKAFSDGNLIDNPKYENIALPDELRGSVKNYKENIYSSPIQTSAGQTHFGSGDSVKNYFGHTRIEDMADNKTRRVIEVQSDLYQKGNLEKEVNQARPSYGGNLEEIRDKAIKSGDTVKAEKYQKLIDETYGITSRMTEVAKLQQYNDPTAHFRMVREEIKKAAQDGKTKLQFPTGETAMKIEGLGVNADNWLGETGRTSNRINVSDLSVGKEIARVGEQEKWIVTDVLGDGKFKAVPKETLSSPIKDTDGSVYYKYGGKTHSKENIVQQFSESFDISGKVDTNNPIYKFYEKEMQKYLNKFGGKRVTDDKGVEWIEVPIKKEYAKIPIEAFALAALKVGGTGATALGVRARLGKDD